VPRGSTAANPDEIADACSPLTYPVAVKGIAPALVHKSDAGAVRLNLASADDASAAAAAMQNAVGTQGIALDGFLVEEMAPAGHEVIVGGFNDPQFGPAVMVGLGGVFVEVFADVAFRLCPIDRADAEEMLAELTATPILEGARGGVAASKNALIDVLLRVGGSDGLMIRFQNQIQELDINPLIVSGNGAVAADARIVLKTGTDSQPQNAPPADDADAIRARFAALFTPNLMAVIGASTNRPNRANLAIDQLLTYGFDREKLIAIHPTATELDGLKAYPSFADTPAPVDYAYVAIPGAGVPDLLRQAKGRLRFAHVTSSGFTESGNDALQQDLVAAVRESGVRVLGPNCNGGYSPRGGLTFCYDALPDKGSVGVILQSGGLGVDTIRRGNHRGLRFSGVMTVGNCADIGPEDLLEFYFADPETRVVGMYLEGVKDGRRMFDLLRNRAPIKPVVILKGGRSDLGQSAAVSHTGALAGDDRIWQALSRQTGAILAETFDEFIDKLLALQCLTPRPDRPTTEAVLFGNGGGTSVLGVDTFARAGITVAPFRQSTVDMLDALALDPGATYTNPVDAPRPVLISNEGRDAETVLRTIFEQESPQMVVMHINMSVIVSQADDGDELMVNFLDAGERVRRDHPDKAHFLLVLRSDGNPRYEEAKVRYRALALDRGIPTYDELPAASNGVAAISQHEGYMARRG
jgi:acyl-CoA synthetase (NDP forming)